MRRAFASLLVPLLLLVTVQPVLANTYLDQAMSHIIKVHDVSEEDVQLYEAGVMELEFTGESFWIARYTLRLGEGADASGEGNVGKPVPPPIGQPEPGMVTTPGGSAPTPSEPDDGRGSVEPAPPDYVYYNTYGAIYIQISTGNILTDAEMESYYNAERKLAEQEWNRLREAAGKLDVYLYRKLLGIPADEKVDVRIVPSPIIDVELREAFAALKDQYPKIAPDLSLDDILPSYYSGGDRGQDSSSPPPPDMAVTDEAVSPDSPAVMVEPAPAIRPGDMPAFPPHDEEYWEEYQAFWSEVEQLRLKSTATSAAEVVQALESMGVAGTSEYGIVEATMTKAQLKLIIELEAVQTITEAYHYDIMPIYSMDMVTIGSGENAPNSAATSRVFGDNNKDDAATSARPVLPVVAGLAVLCLGGAVAVVLRRR